MAYAFGAGTVRTREIRPNRVRRALGRGEDVAIAWNHNLGADDVDMLLGPAGFDGVWLE